MAGKKAAAGPKQTFSYHCDVCDIDMASVSSTNNHLRGRRHLAALDRVERGERSVYIHGFKGSEVDMDQLKSLFEQFGEVRRISSNMQKMTYCFLEFVDVDSALRALKSSRSLMLNGRRLTVKPREVHKRVFVHQKRRGNCGLSRAGPEPMEVASLPPTTKRKVPSAIGGVQFTSESVERLEQAETIEAQIVALVAGSRMPDSTLRDHLRLCLRLQHILQSTFPSLMLVPFGAPVSGQATVTSDCDLCLITEPTSQDRRFLTGSEYYSEKHCTMLDDLAVELTTPTSDATPTHPLGALARDEYHHDDYDMSESGSSTSSPSPGATPTSYSQRSRSCPREFDALLAAVKRNPDCCKVHPIPFARCPIVRFLWEPSGTHCDLSINNRLGPYNTRLVRAYCDRDTRVLPLIAALRCWVRAVGLSRTQIGSYALTIMLVYALQNATPPVLPCLQSPGTWERNMAWFAARGFTGAVTSAMDQSVVVEGWRCGFVPPESLAPSNNTASVAQLLLHFFQFYSEQFNFSDVIAIHVTPPTRLSVQQACSLIREQTALISPPMAANRSFFKVSALCIQDPIELSHNLSKNVGYFVAASLRAHFKVAKTILCQQMEVESACNRVLAAGGLDPSDIKRDEPDPAMAVADVMEEVGEPELARMHDMEGQSDPCTVDLEPAKLGTMVKEGGDLFALFDVSNYAELGPEASQKTHKPRYVSISYDKLLALVKSSSRFQPLLSCVSELDRSHPTVVVALCRVVCEVVVALLVEKFSFECALQDCEEGQDSSPPLDELSPRSLSPREAPLSSPAHPPTSDLPVTLSDSAPSDTHVSDDETMACLSCESPSSPPVLGGPSQSTGASRLGSDGSISPLPSLPPSTDNGMAAANPGTAPCDDDTSDATRKRQRSNQDEEGDEKEKGREETSVEDSRQDSVSFKKARNTSVNATAIAMDVLHELIGERPIAACSYLCSAASNTWQSQRKQKRSKIVANRVPGMSSVASLGASLPEAPPTLEFVLSVVPSYASLLEEEKVVRAPDTLCVLLLSPTSLLFASKMAAFYAVLKQLLVSTFRC